MAVLTTTMGTVLRSQNRSLERGLAILNCFRPGAGSLAHRDLVQETGLPKATVSRLIQTLREGGYLVADNARDGYRLGVPVLSLARAMVLENDFLLAIAPVMRKLAQESETMIGFGAAHGNDMVYIEVANGDRARASRRFGPGTRVPICTSSIGHAYLAGLATAARRSEVARLRKHDHWRPDFAAGIDESVRSLKERGYCMVQFSQGKQASIAAPVTIAGTVYAFGVGYLVRNNRPDEAPDRMVAALRQLIQCVQDGRDDR